MRTKKILLCTLLIAMCFNFSGCSMIETFGLDAITDKWDEMQDETKAEAHKQTTLNNLQNVTNNNHGKDTEKAAKKLTDKQKTLGFLEASIGQVPFIGDWVVSLGQASVDKANADLEVTMANDAVYQQSIKTNGDSNSLWDKLKAGGIMTYMVWIIGMIAVILVIFLFVFRKRGKYESKADKYRAKAEYKTAKAEAKIAERAAATPVEVRRGTDIEITDQAYQRMLLENCQRLQISQEEALQEAGGDMKRAVQNTQLAIAMKN